MNSSFFFRAWAEVDLGALKRNGNTLRARFGNGGQTRIMAVVKADAYGHGAGIVAPAAYESGIRDFGVATIDEAVRLRGILPADSAIYLLTAAMPGEADAIVAHQIVALVGSLQSAESLQAAALRRNTVAVVHLDIDTGIGRAGVRAEDSPRLLADVSALDGIRVEGIATHFASADGDDPEDAAGQYALFAQTLRAMGPRADSLLVHADNSPAALALSAVSRHQLIRPGLLLYGIEPAPGMFEAAQIAFEPVLSVYARVLQVRRLPAGATISYGRTYTVPEGGGDYATIGMGYGDGYPRRLSNSGAVLIAGRRAPIRGRVCMDQLVVDVTGFSTVSAGDVATLIGRDGQERIDASQIAAQIGATPHEIATCLLPRLPRVAV